MQQPFRIGTRGSPLAIWQAEEVRRRLALAHGLPETGAESPFEIVPIKTSGDRIQDRALLEAGGKGLFTKEIEEALARGEIDCAVHSMKDVPTTLPEGFAITAILEREDPRDAWISPRADTIQDLPSGARVGTASLRRGAQVRAARPDVEVVLFRGNVATRLRKLEEGEADATLLAAAGLIRLGKLDVATRVLSVQEMLPAVGQGAVGIETRTDDERAITLVTTLNHGVTATALAAERAFLAELDGSCRTPIAALATLKDDATITLLGKVLSPDGKNIYEIRRSGLARDAADLGRAAGQHIRAEAGDAFFEELRRAVEESR